MAADQSNLRKLVLIGIYAVGLFASVATLVTLGLARAIEGTPQPEIVWVTLGGLIVQFGNGLQAASNYEFGSSAGSAAKNRLLADKQPPDAKPEE